MCTSCDGSKTVLQIGSPVCLNDVFINPPSNETTYCTQLHTLQPNDTCFELSQIYDTSPDRLEEINPGLDCISNFQAGRTICVEGITVPLDKDLTNPNNPNR